MTFSLMVIQGKRLKNKTFSLNTQEGKCLKSQAFSLGKQWKIAGFFPSLGRGKGRKKTCLFPWEKALYPTGIIFPFPRFARPVTGERKGGLSGAAYPSLPLSVTKRICPDPNSKKVEGSGGVILFKQEHVPMILSGRKTQTRRTWRRPRVKVDSVQLAKTGFKKDDAFAQIRITGLRQERLGDISDADVYREGYGNRAQLWDVFKRIYGKAPDANMIVWVVDFELVKAT